MNEETRLFVGYDGGSYVLLGKQGQQVHQLVVGDVIEVQIGSTWHRARVESGGYKGFYYVTSQGQRGRFALCMQVRRIEQQVLASVVQGSPLEQLRLAWVGRRVQSRVPLAVGYVYGVVREITERGQAMFVYMSRANGVPVVATLPVSRLDDFLMSAVS